MIQAEELALEELAVNIPGTSVERPNWRRRLELSVEQLFRGKGAAILKAVRLHRSPPD